MAFGLQDATSDGDTEVMNEINMTPLIDVMLVLLIVFIITVPVMQHAVPVALPTVSSQPQTTKPDTVQLSIDAQGAYFWNQNRVTDSELPRRLQALAAQTPQPDVQIRADKDVRYSFVAQAMAAAQQAGVHKIGFVTDPTR